MIIKMLNTNFSQWPCFTKEEIDKVAEVMRSNKVNYWTGDVTRGFEEEFARYSDAKHGVALANGTVALDLIFAGLGIGAGDEVIVTPRTFLASASSIVTAGAVPVFVDVDRDTQNIRPECVEAALTAKTKAILAVHLAGWSCEMDALQAIADQHDLHLIEDCAQSHGGRYKGQSTGSFGIASAWSFCQDKIMTTGGEGGMVTTSDEALWSRMWSYKDHGKSWDAVYNRDHKPGFRWVHESFGTNWRMMEMQAAIGSIQLNRMPGWTVARQRNANVIWETARSLDGLRAPVVPDYIEHACYKCYVFVEPELLKPDWSRDRVIEEISSRGVPVMAGSCSEVYLEKAFDGTGFRPDSPLPIAKELGETSLMLMVHPTLTEQEISKTCDVLSEVMKMAVR